MVRWSASRDDEENYCEKIIIRSILNDTTIACDILHWYETDLSIYFFYSHSTNEKYLNIS